MHVFDNTIVSPQLVCTVQPTAARPHISIRIDHHTIDALYDTGAAPNCLHPQVAELARAQGAVLGQVGTQVIRTAAGNQTTPQPVYAVRVQVGGRSYTGPFTIVPNLTSPVILGMNAIRTLGLAYSPSKNSFHFERPLHGKASAAKESVQTKTITVYPAKQQCIEPYRKKTVLLTAVTVSKEPVTNCELVASINGADVLVRTDNNGHFSICMSNISPQQLTYARTDPLGYAEVEANFDMLGSVTEESMAGLGALCGESEHNSIEVQKQFMLDVQQATSHLEPATQRRLQDILTRRQDCISKHKFDLGLTKILAHKIELTNTTPVYHRQFPIPMEHAPVIKDHVEKWLAMGIVEPAQSPYNSPIFCVKKKTGGYRLCLDYRGINDRSAPTNYSIRTPEDCIAEIGQAGAKHFIALDLSSGFYQMPLDPASRPITAFTVPQYGQLQWTRGAMGLKGCPGSFARLMDMALKGIDNVLIYIDDVLIYGKTQQEALDTLDRVMQRLIAHNLKINIQKSTFLQPKTSYLGFILATEGIYPGKDKTDAIAKAQPPTSTKQLKSFLGLINYFRSFVKHFAQKAGKLYALTRKDSHWKQGPLPKDALATFHLLRNAIARTVPRAFPFRTGKYHLFTDASLGDDKEEGGLGAHLMQEDAEGQLHSIAFASRALQKHEKNYSAFLLELQAAVWAIDYFSHYLRGRTFVLLTDHAPLTKLSTVHTKTLHRLHELLNQYSFEMKYVAGKNNSVADFLSRSHGPTAIAAIAAMTDGPNLQQLQLECDYTGPILKALITGRPPHWPQDLSRAKQLISVHGWPPKGFP